MKDDYNKTKVYGGRIQAKLNINDGWSAIASLNYQNTKADGLNSAISRTWAISTWSDSRTNAVTTSGIRRR
ncbi:MAG: hypothetical protein R3C58_03745 [Parvularculaceae bacterium]